MRKFIVALVLLVSFICFISGDVFSRPISGCSEALTAGNSFLNEVIERFGSWGGEANPYIKGCQEFTDNKGRVVGYFLPVVPKGYIMLNTLTQLSPVMAYSETSDLNVSSQRGMAQLLRDYMGDTRDFLEKKYGKLENVPEFGIAPDSNREMWDYYLKKGPAPKRDSDVVVGPLLRTRWDSKVSSLNGLDALQYGPGLGNI
ncbi:MAG: hypothetical protein QXU75_08645 [Candidatus Methanomethylicaceae archaeon]